MTAPARPAAAPAPRLPFGLAFARARLWLGITGVGAMVLLAAAALALDLPGRALAGDPAQPLGAAVAQVLAALLVPTLLLVPLDVAGGRVVRDRPGAGAWAAGWLRGVAVQLLVWAAAAAALLAAARAGARWGPAGAAVAAVAAYAGAQLALLAGRAWLARAVAALRVAPLGSGDAGLAAAARAAGLDPVRVRRVGVDDVGFTGGWMGVRARTLWVPAHWAALPPDALAAQLARRAAVADAGLHARGVVGALAWNVLGLALVLALVPAADPTTAAGLASAAAGLTLWAFLGALVLPTPSRAAVYAADAAAARRLGPAPVRAAVTALDRWQDDEAERPAAVEAVFHPVPARGGRLRRLADGTPDDGARAPAVPAAHQVARHALYLSWAGLVPLARAVHCNVGRPALWVVWPGD